MPARAYRIETERLVIRCYNPKDAPLLKASIDESIEHLLPWMVWAKFEPETVEKKIERLRKYRGQFDLGLDYTFGIFSKDESILIGSTGLHTRREENVREIGYWINGNYIRRGYISETVAALTKVGFEIEGQKRIEIRCTPDNLASQAVPRKLGFTHEATLKNRELDADNNPKDMMIWTMFREDYLNTKLPTTPITAYDIIGEEILLV